MHAHSRYVLKVSLNPKEDTQIYFDDVVMQVCVHVCVFTYPRAHNTFHLICCAFKPTRAL